MNTQLASPRSSRVTAESLIREVDEYFAGGAQVAPGQTVIDVGANIGAFALRIAERCQGDVRLLCFEPAPATYHALENNFTINEWLKKTVHTLFPLGLSSPANSGQSLTFYHFSRFETNSTFDVASKRREFELFFEDRSRRLTARLGPFSVLGRILERGVASSVWRGFIWWLLRRVMGLEEMKARVTTLGQILTSHQIALVDLLKIDVEGAELDVLLGLDAETWPRVQQVVMETHNRDGRQATIERLLAEHGLTKIDVHLQRAVDNGLDSVIITARRPACILPATAEC